MHTVASHAALLKPIFYLEFDHSCKVRVLPRKNLLATVMCKAQD